jgi:large repetitive protein
MPLERRFAPSYTDPCARRASGRLALVALVLILAAGARAGLAADFTVNSTADAVDANLFDSICATATGACTLRAAIQQANASNPFGGTTIHLPAGTYLLTRTGTNEDSSATGDLDLLASNGVTIAGAGAATTIIHGNGIDRVLDIRIYANATISGLSITGGSATE